MKDTRSFLSGMGLGALIMYVMDPVRGTRRRSLARDQVVHAGHKFSDFIDATVHDLRNRAYGTFSEMKSMLTFGEDVPDQVIEARVRSTMGRVVSHPRALTVTADGGRVRLSGPILQHEVDNLLRAVSSVRGVTSVENNLDVHTSSENISALQGGRPRPGVRSEFAETYWSPATRFLAGTAGSALLLYGTRRRDMFGIGVGALGLSLASRALTNLEMKRLTGIGAGRRAVDVQKTIQINAPVEEVFNFWDNYQNFPHFMSNVREVRDLGDNRSRWVVAGPLGTNVEWDAVVTERIPNQVIAWKTLSSPIVGNAGIVRFDSLPDGGTRVDIKLSYNPPAGAIGHGFASLFGVDPETEMDEDLARMKTMIETGKPPRDASKPIQEKQVREQTH